MWVYLVVNGVGVWFFVMFFFVLFKDGVVGFVGFYLINRLKCKFVWFGYEVNESDEYDVFFLFNVIVFLRYFWNVFVDWEELEL